jgi:AmmeMemoRadiSam system protein A
MDGNVNGPIDACGEMSIRVLMRLAKMRGLKPMLLDARNSQDITGQIGGGYVVGYASIVYVKEVPADAQNPNISAKPQDEDTRMELTDQDKQFFLTLARQALEKAVKQEPPPAPRNVPAVGREKCGCFVTLTKGGNLRGCIGYLDARKPLYEAVIDNAKNAALADPRFPKVAPKELKQLKVEVSVLTRPVPLAYDDPQDLLDKLAPGKDGLILRKGMSQSTFLPQVWDQIPDKVEFLEHLSRKAGLPGDAWKSAQYLRYHAIHFEEH